MRKYAIVAVVVFMLAGGFYGYTAWTRGKSVVCHNLMTAWARKEIALNPDRGSAPYDARQTYDAKNAGKIQTNIAFCPLSGKFTFIPHSDGSLTVHCSYPGHGEVTVTPAEVKDGDWGNFAQEK